MGDSDSDVVLVELVLWKCSLYDNKYYSSGNPTLSHCVFFTRSDQMLLSKMTKTANRKFSSSVFGQQHFFILPSWFVSREQHRYWLLSSLFVLLFYLIYNIHVPHLCPTAGNGQPVQQMRIVLFFPLCSPTSSRFFFFFVTPSLCISMFLCSMVSTSNAPLNWLLIITGQKTPL